VFPLSTFFINLLGSLAIGFLCGLAAKHSWFGRELGLVLITGLCGGFTTFSAFSWENSNLLLSGNALTAVGYTLLSVVIGIALCRVGFWLSHYT
jgi:fluoride exporter